MPWSVLEHYPASRAWSHLRLPEPLTQPLPERYFFQRQPISQGEYVVHVRRDVGECSERVDVIPLAAFNVHLKEQFARAEAIITSLQSGENARESAENAQGVVGYQWAHGEMAQVD